jgi:hypothetical protein
MEETVGGEELEKRAVVYGLEAWYKIKHVLLAIKEIENERAYGVWKVSGGRRILAKSQDLFLSEALFISLFGDV